MNGIHPAQATPDERSWAVLTHLSALLGYFFPFGGIIGPLIFWSIKKETSEFVNAHGRSAVNFHLTWTLVTAAGWILWISQFFGLIGWAIKNGDSPEELPVGYIVRALLLLIPIVTIYLFRFVLMLVGTISASNGSDFRYPLTIGFLRG